MGVFGTSHNDNRFITTLYVQSGIAQYQETESGAGWEVNPEYQILTDTNSESVNAGDSNGNLSISVTFDADMSSAQYLSVAVTLVGSLNGATPPAAEPPTQTVLPGEVWNVPEFSLDDGGTFPDRVYFRNLTVTNIPGPI